jgi:hypothetical protein
MSKLSPTQERILKAAAVQPEVDVRDFMADVKSPAIKDTVVASMLKKGLIYEGDQDGGVAYLISDAGLEAVGAKRAAGKEAEAEAGEAAHATTEEAPATPEEPAGTVKAETESAAPKVTKQQIIIDLLKRPGGATLEQMMEATGWQRHSVRGVIAGGLKKKLSLEITASKEADGARVYKIA